MIRIGPIIGICFSSFLLLLGQAEAQRHGGFAGGGSGRAMGQSSPASQGAAQPQASGGQAGASRAGTFRGQGGRHFATPLNAIPPNAQVPLFPNLLGNTVGLQAFPPVITTTPGIGNINQPGLPPGAPTIIPNVNNPAGPFFGEPVGRPLHGFGGHHGQRFSGPVFVPFYYAVPYVPYYYPYEAPPSPEAAPAPEQPVEPPSPSGPSTPQLYYVPPEATGEQPGQPPAAPEVSKSEAIPVPATPKGKPVTLLAFKDKSLIAVTDYWLKGDTVYYLRNGAETGIPLDQLDLPLTQQLNRERHVPFILESRP